jgi:protein TonB
MASHVTGPNRRLGVGLLAAALFHALLFGLGMMVPARPQATRATPKSVDVELVAARPDPPQQVSRALAARRLSVEEPVAAPAVVRRLRSKPLLRPPIERPAAAGSPGAAAAEPPARDVSLRPAASTEGPHGPAIPSASAPNAPARALPAGAAAVTVTARPRYRSNPEPEYPLSARRNRQEGVVLLTVGVAVDGRPADIALKQSSGHPSLDEAAIDAVRGWTFDPARAGGVAVPSHVVVPVRFSMTRR